MQLKITILLANFRDLKQMTEGLHVAMDCHPYGMRAHFYKMVLDSVFRKDVLGCINDDLWNFILSHFRSIPDRFVTSLWVF